MINLRRTAHAIKKKSPVEAAGNVQSRPSKKPLPPLRSTTDNTVTAKSETEITSNTDKECVWENEYCKTTPNVIIYILCHTKESYEEAKIRFAKYYWARPIILKTQNFLFENTFWTQLLDIRENWINCDMVGTLSARADTKVNISDIDSVIKNRKKWFCMTFHHFYTINEDLRMQTEREHPGLLSILVKVVKELDISISKNLLACNYWMTTPKHMIQFSYWFTTIVKPTVLRNPACFNKCKYNPLYKMSENTLRKLTGVPYYPMVPFLFERLNCSFFLKSYKKVLILYVLHKVTKNVLYFIENGLFKSATYDFLIIVNSSTIQLPDVPNLSFPNVSILYRENKGYDFGGWTDGLYSNNRYKQYDAFIFINSSVIGPFVKHIKKEYWPLLFLNELNPLTKLCGTTINYDGLYGTKFVHVQSMVFAVDKYTLQFLMDMKIFNHNVYETNFLDVIANYEIRMSQLIIHCGWNICCLQNTYKFVNFLEFNPEAGLGNINLTISSQKAHLSSPYEVVFMKSTYKKAAGDESREESEWIIEWARKESLDKLASPEQKHIYLPPTAVKNSSSK